MTTHAPPPTDITGRTRHPRRLTRTVPAALAGLLAIGIVPVVASTGGTAEAAADAGITAIVRSSGDAPMLYVNGASPDALGQAKGELDSRRYTVTLTLGDCVDGRAYHWFVRSTGTEDFTRTSPQTGCAPATIGDIPAGDLVVTVKGFDASTTATVDTATVKVGTRIVVGLGESYASGEGLPPYDDNGCHRSARGLQGRIAAAGSAQVPVMFFHLACSGANTASMFNAGNAPIGTLPGFPGPPIDSQFADLQKVIDVFGVPDAVLLSNGGNDVPYTAYVFQCGAVGNPGCDPTNPAQATRTGDIKSHLDMGLARTRTNYDIFASCLNGATGGGTLSVPTGPPATSGSGPPNSTDMSQMERQDVPVTCPLRTPVPADRVLMTGYPNGFTGPGGHCVTDNPPIVSINANQSRWLDENFLQPLSVLTQEVATAKGWKYVATYEAFAGHGTCATGDDQWIFGLLGAGAGEPRGSWHPTARGAEEYGRLAGPTLSAMLAPRAAATERTPQVVRVCHLRGAPSATIQVHAGNSTVDAGRELTVRTSVGETKVVLRPGKVDYRPTVPVDPDAPGQVRIYDTDVSLDNPTLVADIPVDGCEQHGPSPSPTEPPAPQFSCPSTGRPATAYQPRLQPGGQAPDDETVICNLTEPMVLLSSVTHAWHSNGSTAPDKVDTFNQVAADQDSRYIFVPAGQARITYRTVHKEWGLPYDGTALELTVTDQAGNVLLSTQRDLFHIERPKPYYFYPAQVVAAVTLVEMYHADHPSANRWSQHLVATHWFEPYCGFVSRATVEPPNLSGNHWATVGGERYLVNRTGSILGEAQLHFCQ